MSTKLLFSRQAVLYVLIILILFSSFPLQASDKTPEISRIDNFLGMEFVYIESGTFMMGSPEA